MTGLFYCATHGTNPTPCECAKATPAPTMTAEDVERLEFIGNDGKHLLGAVTRDEARRILATYHALADAQARIAALRESLVDWDNRVGALQDENARLTAALVNACVPIEALILDDPSQGYVGPTLLSVMQSALADARAALARPATPPEGTSND